jgi:hypothetical protein
MLQCIHLKCNICLCKLNFHNLELATCTYPQMEYGFIAKLKETIQRFIGHENII